MKRGPSQATATTSSPPSAPSISSTSGLPVMEERTSSFVEMRGIDSPVNGRKSRNKSQHSAQNSAPTASPPIVTGGVRDSIGSSHSHQSRHTVVYNESDANQMILRANAPPNYSGGFESIMKQMKAKKYYTEQFQRVQQQTGMNKLLYFDDSAPYYYESNYLALAQSSSVMRVRGLFLIGLIALAAFYGSEWHRGLWDPAPNGNQRSLQDKHIIIVLTFGVIIPTFLLGLLSTFTAFGKKNLENITFIVFVIVAAAMIAKKPIEKISGPVIPLLILLIPIFGITRMRFVKSCIIGWGIFFSYFIVMSIARELVPVKKTFDNYTDISYQTINYGISVIGGMVSQYRQELLRRRNFCLQLPFSGTLDSDALLDMQTDKFSKRSLMHMWSQKFRHPEVEECFYRYWYLIDPFPYENPNSGSLHQGVFRTIRFAVYTLFLNQFVLLLQDIKFLKVKKDANVQPSDFIYAIVLRMGVTVPLYLSAALFMYFVGKAFYAKWVREAEEARDAALARESQVEVEVKEPVNGHTEDPKMKLVVDAAMLKQKTKIKVMDALLNKGGYVRSTQMFSSVVIACHVACMGVILLAVSTGNGKGGKPKPVYYMGFLNSVLFAHRSGFRVRFVYATYTTFIVAAGIIIAASSLSPSYYLEYMGFVLVILLMGMMISYEEENLRRTFFVLKSIRTLEFEEWFSVVLRLQGWVRERFKKKLETVRSKGSKELTDNDVNKKKKKRADPPLINTSAQMAQASKFGMYSQMGNIVIALIDLLTTALK